MSEIVTEYNKTKNVFFDVTKTHYFLWEPLSED